MLAGLPILGLAIGFVAVYLVPFEVSGNYGDYLAVAALAGLDAIFGGIRAGIEGKFHDDIFISGFVVNTLLAAGLAYLGDQIGVSLFTAAVVALGGRIFLNLSLIRRYWLTQAALTKRKET